MLAGHCWGGFDAAGGAEPLGGLPAGLHAKGFPSGAQHVPVMEPRSVVKLHCIPLLEPSQAWIASGGGARCCPGSPGGCDIAAAAASAAACAKKDLYLSGSAAASEANEAGFKIAHAQNPVDRALAQFAGQVEHGLGGVP